MTAADRDAVVDLLARGFPARSRDDWGRIIDRLRAHTDRGGFDHYGHALESRGALVGILLKIFHRAGPTADEVRCNVSSWYVEERFRTYGSMLVATATREATVTYLNVTPERATRETVEAQGFTRYAGGVVIAAPLLARRPRETIRAILGDLPDDRLQVDPVDLSVMRAEVHRDCIRLWMEAAGRAHPFLLVRRRIGRGRIAAAHLVYCRDVAEIGRFARPIGVALARRGIFLMSLDANGPVAGLTGRLLADRMPKYAKGPVTPRLGDLAFTEIAMFGV